MALQERMVDGSFMCDKEGPYKNMHELWDGEETQDSLHSLMGGLTQKATTA